MLGIWEPHSISLLKQFFKVYFRDDQGLVFCDIGANIGLYSLWFSKIVTVKGLVYAFEPTPQTSIKLASNITLNDLKNVEVIEKACSNINGNIDFYIGHHHTKSSLSSSWAKGDEATVNKITVATVALDDFFYKQNLRLPHFIKMDIEGGAVFALQGCARLAVECRPVFFIESHTPEEDRAISNFMLTYKYSGYQVEQNRFIANPSEIYPHPEGVWGNMLIYPEEKQSSIISIINV